MHSLRTLQLPNIQNLTGLSIIRVASSCPVLENLNLCLCTGVDDKCMEEVAKRATKLKKIHLVSCDITDKSRFA